MVRWASRTRLSWMHTRSADGHTASNAPDLFRPPKLSGAGPGQYWGGGPPGKPLGCCQLFALRSCSSARKRRLHAITRSSVYYIDGTGRWPWHAVRDKIDHQKTRPSNTHRQTGKGKKTKRREDKRMINIISILQNSLQFRRFRVF